MDPVPNPGEDHASTPLVRVRCEGCGLLAGVPLTAAASDCPSCGASLRLSRVHSIGDDGFTVAVLQSPIPVLVDFHAEWCGPCRWLDPVLDELARASAGRFLIAKVDTDLAPETARTYRIASVPTVVLFKDGHEVDRSIGVEPDRLRAMVLPDASGARTGS